MVALLSRRRVLQITGASASFALTGCLAFSTPSGVDFIFKNATSTPTAIAVWVHHDSSVPSKVYSANLGLEGSKKTDDTATIEKALYHGDGRYPVEVEVQLDGVSVLTENYTVRGGMTEFVFTIQDSETVDLHVVQTE